MPLYMDQVIYWTQQREQRREVKHKIAKTENKLKRDDKFMEIIL